MCMRGRDARPDAFARSACSIAGIRNAIVLPVPVFAFASKSTPVSARGIVLSWTSVMNSYPITSATACFVLAAMLRSAKRPSVICDLVVDEVRDVDFTAIVALLLATLLPCPCEDRAAPLVENDRIRMPPPVSAVVFFVENDLIVFPALPSSRRPLCPVSDSSLELPPRILLLMAR